jgi:hypothetical protein
MIFIDALDAYFGFVRDQGAVITFGPRDCPWGTREFHVQCPDGHVIRFGGGVGAQAQEP